MGEPRSSRLLPGGLARRKQECLELADFYLQMCLRGGGQRASFRAMVHPYVQKNAGRHRLDREWQAVVPWLLDVDRNECTDILIVSIFKAAFAHGTPVGRDLIAVGIWDQLLERLVDLLDVPREELSDEVAHVLERFFREQEIVEDRGPG